MVFDDSIALEAFELQMTSNDVGGIICRQAFPSRPVRIPGIASLQACGVLSPDYGRLERFDGVILLLSFHYH